MGFGECFMLCNDDECLLIDCGSESDNKDIYFGYVSSELKMYKTCSAMISHFHEDHMNGFRSLLTSFLHKFEQVYIPHIFTTGQHNNQVDYLIMQYLLEQTPYVRSRTYHLWDLLTDLVTTEQHICLLERGKPFQEVNTDCETLWPIPQEIINDKLCNIKCSELSFLSQFVPQINKLSEELSNCFLSIADPISDDLDWSSIRQRCQDFSDHLESLKKSFAEAKKATQAESRKQEICKKIRECYVKLDKNCTSIVFHTNTLNKPVLFTGDVTRSIMAKIARNEPVPSAPIRSHYYAIKVPHHGTYTDHYFNFGPYASYDYLMISNGETNNPTKRGKISAQYLLKNKNYCVCCTNDDDKRCDATYPSIFQRCNNCICNGNPPRRIITI